MNFSKASLLLLVRRSVSVKAEQRFHPIDAFRLRQIPDMSHSEASHPTEVRSASPVGFNQSEIIRYYKTYASTYLHYR